MSEIVKTYDAGDPVRLAGTFTNVGGTYTDPSSVYLYVIPPAQAGNIVPGTWQYDYASGSIARQAAGSFTYDINPLPSGTPGVWRYSYIGTGVLNAAVHGAFAVRQG